MAWRCRKGADPSEALHAWRAATTGRPDAPGARQLLTHPGVGAVTALTTVLVLGPVRRFPGSKEVASYIGLGPTPHPPADTRHLGPNTKQGKALLRMVLVPTAATAAPYHGDLERL